jgi:hypothetical protein
MSSSWELETASSTSRPSSRLELGHKSLPTKVDHQFAEALKTWKISHIQLACDEHAEFRFDAGLRRLCKDLVAWNLTYPEQYKLQMECFLNYRESTILENAPMKSYSKTNKAELTAETTKRAKVSEKGALKTGTAPELLDFLIRAYASDPREFQNMLSAHNSALNDVSVG